MKNLTLQTLRPNIYKLLTKEFKIFDILIDVGCKGFYDLIDFEYSPFKKIIGIDKEFERNNPFGDYRQRKTENLNLTDEEWRKYSSELIQAYNKRFDIKIMNFFDYDFGSNKNSLIICNKVLHFYNYETKLILIEKFYKSLQKDGIIYLRINHWLHTNNTDLNKMTKISEHVYQNKEVPEDIRFLIVPTQFINYLKDNYQLLPEMTFEDSKTLTLVLKK